METIKFKTVDQYIEEVPAQVRERIGQVRETVAKAAPLAEETISYNMPALRYKKVLLYYAAFRHHIGFYAIPRAHAHFKEELSPYKQGKGSVQFPHDRPLPLELIGRMAAFRYGEQFEEGDPKGPGGGTPNETNK